MKKRKKKQWHVKSLTDRAILVYKKKKKKKDLININKKWNEPEKQAETERFHVNISRVSWDMLISFDSRSISWWYTCSMTTCRAFRVGQYTPVYVVSLFELWLEWG